MVFGCNLDVEDPHLIPGEPVAVLEAVVAQERHCEACGTADIDAWVIDDCEQCTQCNMYIAGGRYKLSIIVDPTRNAQSDSNWVLWL